MKQIKICCLKKGITSIPELANEIYLWDQEIVSHMVWEENHPDYVIATQHIYSNKKLLKKFNELCKDEHIIRIFAAGEAVYPDLNIFDYALVFNQNLQDSDRVVSDSIFYAQKEFTFVESNNFTYADAIAKLNSKPKFCNFIYSNPYAHPMRDKLFYLISRYKGVDSIGMHLHNTNVQPSRYDANWCEKSIDIKSNYKFSIASENALFDGYTSEKLITSFQAHTVPIYFGNESVKKEFNAKAFINVNDYSSLDDLLAEIIQIDNDDDAWCRMVCEPWQTEEQSNYSKIKCLEYYEFIKHIFEQDIQSAKRRPEGDWPNMYLKWFVRPLRKEYDMGKLFTKFKKLPYKIRTVLKK